MTCTALILAMINAEWLEGIAEGTSDNRCAPYTSLISII